MEKQVHIIGGGISGLTAGILLSERGIPCTLLEKNAEPGGLCTAWEREGFLIDGCLHWLTGTLPGTALYDLWVRLGAISADAFIYLPALYTSEWHGQTLALCSDFSELRAQMLQLSPEDREEILRLTDGVAALIAAIRAGRTLSISIIWGLGRTPLRETAMKFRHPLLRQFFTDYLPGALPTAAWLLMAAHFCSGNGALPAGGSRTVPERMTKKFRALGGTLRCNAEVTRVRLQPSRVEALVLAEDAETVSQVIFACDPEVTFRTLLDGRYLPPALARRGRNPNRFPLYSMLHAAFAVPLSSPIPAGTTVIDGGSALGQRIAVRNFSYDPAFVRGSETVVQCMMLCRESECTDWLRQTEACYQEARQRLGERFTQVLHDRWGIAPHLLDIWTPVTYAQTVGANHGAGISFGWTVLTDALAGVPTQIAGLDNAYLATQWQRIPGGLPCAAKAGVLAANRAARALS